MTTRRVVDQACTLDIIYRNIKGPRWAPAGFAVDFNDPSVRARFVVKAFIDDPDERALFDGRIGSGVYGIEMGRALVVIVDAATTLKWQAPATVIYALKIACGQYVWTEDEGEIRVLPAVCFAI